MKMLVIASCDSQLKVASCLANVFLKNGWAVDVRIPKIESKQISKKQVEDSTEFGVVHHCKNSIDSILDGVLDYGVIIVLTDGSLTQRVCFEFYRRANDIKRRPILITGFVGVNLFDTAMPYQLRLNSDLIFMNAEKDRDDCSEIAALYGISNDYIIASGLPFVGKISKPFSPVKNIRNVVFAGQPDVPGRIIERIYIIEKLVEHAKIFPERHVYLKPRHRPSEKSFHFTKHHYEVLLKTYLRGVDIPSNFSITYDPIHKLLDSCELLITVSSTAALEALSNGCQVAILSDFGISQTFGSQYFLGSGMLYSFEDLLNGHQHIPNLEWVEYHVGCNGDSSELIYNKCKSLLDIRNSGELKKGNDRRLTFLAENAAYIEKRNNELVKNILKSIYYFTMRFLRRHFY